MSIIASGGVVGHVDPSFRPWPTPASARALASSMVTSTLSGSSFRVALPHQIAQPADDLPGALGLFGHPLDRLLTAGLVAGGEQPPGAVDVVGHRGQRLVDLMRQRRHQLAEFVQPRDVDQFGLQILHPAFAFLAFGQVADEAGEQVLARQVHGADRQFHGKGACRPRRKPTTTRPMPMIRRSPVLR